MCAIACSYPLQKQSKFISSEEAAGEHLHRGCNKRSSITLFRAAARLSAHQAWDCEEKSVIVTTPRHQRQLSTSAQTDSAVAILATGTLLSHRDRMISHPLRSQEMLCHSLQVLPNLRNWSVGPKQMAVSFSPQLANGQRGESYFNALKLHWGTVRTRSKMN